MLQLFQLISALFLQSPKNSLHKFPATMRHFRFSSIRRENSNNGSEGGSPPFNVGGSDGDTSSLGGSEQVKLKKYCRYGTFAWSRELSSDNRPRLAELENTFFGKRVSTVPSSSQTELANTPSPDEPCCSLTVQYLQPHLAYGSIVKSSSTSSGLISSQQLQPYNILQSTSLEEPRTNEETRVVATSSSTGNVTRNDSLAKVGRTATVPAPKPTRLSLSVSPRTSRHSSRTSFLKGYVIHD